MPSLSIRQHFSPYITLFLLLPLIFLIIPNPLERLYRIATFNINISMTMTDQDQDHRDHSHGHEHTHHHHDHHSQDADTTSPSTTFLEKNRAHWNSRASTYTSAPWAKEMLNSIHAFVLSNINWIGVPFVEPSTSFEYNPSASTQASTSGPASRPIRILDYACGSGTITNILYSHANEFLGIDISERMVEEYNRRFSHSLPVEVAGTNARAVVGNLINPSTSAEDGTVKEAEPNSFDLVVVGLGFHHFENLDLAVQRLGKYCSPEGGVLVIVDLLAHGKEGGRRTEEDGGESNPAKHTVAHHGFNETQMRELFERNGLTGGFGFVVMEGEVLMRGTERRRVFMARGVRGKM